MIRQSWEYVSKEMDKLYEKKLDSEDAVSIDQHCQFMVDFLHACGWTEEQYTLALFGIFNNENSSIN